MTDAAAAKARELSLEGEPHLLQRLMQSREKFNRTSQDFARIRDASKALDDEIQMIEAALCIKHPHGGNFIYQRTLVRLPNDKHSSVKYEAFQTVP